MMENARPIGQHLKRWRQHRHLSQLDLALDAEISARHLSFVETGRSHPSREVVLRLAEELDVPLRERNVLLLAAGYAPVFPERSFDDPTLADGRRIIEGLLAAHAPFPAIAVDRHWSLIAANAPTQALLAGVGRELLAPPANVLRIALHPDGLARRIANLDAWRAHVFDRLRRQIDASADPVLADLLAELRSLPGEQANGHERSDAIGDTIAVPFRLRTDHGILDFITTTTIFGTPVDVMLSEIAVESFFPANTQTATALNRLAAA